MIRVSNLQYQIKEKAILSGINLQLKPGQFYGVVGPNGSGKSTLLRLLAGLTLPRSGEIIFDGVRMEDWQEKDLAQNRCLLQQSNSVSLPYTVKDLIKMGRYPFLTISPPAENAAIVKQAMEFMEVQPFAERSCMDLSGGELQRVQIARVLAQLLGKSGVEGKVLLADEPLNNLDIKHQQETMKILKTLADAGALVIAVLHDLNLSLQYCDQNILLNEGMLVEVSPPESCLRAENIKQVFGVQSRLVKLGESKVVNTMSKQGDLALIYE